MFNFRQPLLATQLLRLFQWLSMFKLTILCEIVGICCVLEGEIRLGLFLDVLGRSLQARRVYILFIYVRDFVLFAVCVPVSLSER